MVNKIVPLKERFNIKSVPYTEHFLFFLNYSQDIGKNFTFTFSPGGSLLKYKLHGDELHRFQTFRTNSWIRYRINPRHQIVVAFAMGNDQVELSHLNTMDQTIDFLQIKRGNPNLDNTKLYEYSRRIKI